jgi:hypothetical protein
MLAVILPITASADEGDPQEPDKSEFVDVPNESNNEGKS